MKKIFSTMAVAAALFAGYCAYSGQNSNELSDVALANVEALAQSETAKYKCKGTYYVCESNKSFFEELRTICKTFTGKIILIDC